MRVISDADLIRVGEAHAWSAVRLAREFGVTERAIQARVVKLKAAGHDILRPNDPLPQWEGNKRIPVELQNGTIIVGSDCHYWPGIVTTAHRAFVHLVKQLKPDVVILNGDICDFPTIGRFDREGWKSLPTVKQELEAVQDRVHEIFAVSGKAKRIRTRGNHDFRFERRLANAAPEYEGIGGSCLADHLPGWQECVSVWVNGDECVIKHRWHLGVHASYNNVLRSGTSIVCGHRHSLEVRPYTDYRGTRYGVDTGMMADEGGPMFDYGEDNPSNHRSGFALLTFLDGHLMPPELCQVIGEGRAYFRGKVIEV